MTGAGEAAVPKVDPESLAIRGRPPRAIRFKRGVIIAIAALGSVSLTAVTWMALKPHFAHAIEAQEELARPNANASNDALARAPTSYGDVPKLGPPLPGDLAKPILEHQQSEMAAVSPADQQRQQAAASEQERRLSELKAARESSVLVQNRQAPANATVAAVPPLTSVSATSGAQKLTLDPDHDPTRRAARRNS